MAILAATFLVAALQLPLSLRFPEVYGITPIAWGTLSLLAFAQTILSIRRAPSGLRWKWTLLGLHFLLNIAGLLCILYAEYITRFSQPALWLNDLFRTCKLIVLLLAACTQEEAGHPFNRLLDTLQALLIAAIFFTLFSPDFLHTFSAVIVKPDAVLVNRYNDTQAIFLALVTLLTVFTAKTVASRLFHTALAIYVWIAVPASIYTNEFVNNRWRLPPSSVHHLVGDIAPIAFLFACTWLSGRLKPREPGTILIFLGLGASVFLPFFAMLASMLLAITGRHTKLAIAAGITALALYGLRSTYGQFQLLDIQSDLQTSNQRLEFLSTRDPLTALYNRRWFDEHFALEWKRAQRTRSPISLLIIDIDHFKLYNDTHGHAQGDLCLQAVSERMLKPLTRATDALIRYGGEEFLAMLPNTSAEGALQIAQTIHASLEANPIPHPASPLGRLTLSIGIATTHPHTGDPNATSLLLQADTALYRAKAEGRNRIHQV